MLEWGMDRATKDWHEAGERKCLGDLAVRKKVTYWA